MAQPNIQTSFHAGEWAPALNARVDLAKYHSAAALLRNFYVDYRGGASTRAGTKWITQAYKSATAVRLISFQASFAVTYVLELGDFYIRFISDGSPVLEAANAITGISQANPGVFTVVAHGYNPGEWIFVEGVSGMTQVNDRYFIVATVLDADHFTVTDLFGAVVNTLGYTPYTSGGTAQRIYTIPSPWAAADLALVKFAQNVDTMVLCHPDYPAQLLTLVTAADWMLVPLTYAPTISPPTNLAATTSSAGAVNFSYYVTAVDINGQESLVSNLASSTITSNQFVTISLTWDAIPGAQSYNIYRAGPSTNVIASGAAFGFIQNVTTNALGDSFSSISPYYPADYTQTIPISRNPFQGAGVISATMTSYGIYTSPPTVAFDPSPDGGTAIGRAILGGLPGSVPTIAGCLTGFAPGDTVTFLNGLVIVVDTVDIGGTIVTIKFIGYPGSNTGAFITSSPPANPNGQVVATSGGGNISGLSVNFQYGVVILQIIQAGSGYTSAPAITFSAGIGFDAGATAILGSASLGNPSVPMFYQQRLTLAAQAMSPQTINWSQPQAYYNFNVTDPIQDDDAISATLVSGQLNSIKALVPMQSGLIALTDVASWLINGGGAGTAITPADITANPQSYIGANDVPPIVANFDILFVQAKGSVIRDVAFDFYTNVFKGTDISVLSSHLFYGYQILEWAWAEEPFKLVYAIRNDGTLLNLTFMKEQELIGWAHSDTQGSFTSVASVTEQVATGSVNATYVVVERIINGQTLKYIERFAERIFPNGATDAWCVDSGLQYDGAPATTFTGAQHLTGATITGLADGSVIPPTVVDSNGTFVLGTAASKVTVGLAYTAQLETLAIDLGEPTVQGKRKKIVAVDVRCQETLGLSIGKTFSTLVPMKDLVVGNVGSQTNAVVTGLVTGDARTIIDPSWDVPGQYCIQQSYPLPATILGVIPEITVGDTIK